MDFKMKFDDDLYKREILLEKFNEEVNLDFVFPIARRIATQTIGLDIASVQPLGLPTGLLFYNDNEPENLYKRKLIIERKERKGFSYYPNYHLNRFKPPGVYIRETDFSTFDLVTEPSFDNAMITTEMYIEEPEQMPQI